jgi:RNA polymerase sigma-70 factor (ECF subfamily)
VEPAKLLELARSGDVAAYRGLLESCQDAALRTAQLLTRDRGEAEDAVQEAFVKAFRRIGELREDGAFRGWLLRIVANESLNRLRSAGRRRSAHERSWRTETRPDVSPSAEAEMLAADQRDTLLQAVNRLTEDDRLVIGCRYFLELSLDETAQVCAIPAGTVKSRQSRALGRLRALLAEFETDPLEANNV